MDDNSLPEAPTIRLLGLSLPSNLSWSQYITSIAKSASRKVKEIDKTMSDDETDDSNEEKFQRKSRKRKMFVFTDEEDESDSSDDEEEEEVEDEEQCPICLSEFSDQLVGKPESCKHLFCFECLEEWAKKMNNCPVDRMKFNSMLKMRGIDGPVLEDIFVENRDVTEEDFEDPPTYCQVCSSCEREDELLLCDQCDNGYHLDCLTPALTSVPIDEWFCPVCAANRKTKDSGDKRKEEMLESIYARFGEGVVFSEDAPRVRTAASRRRSRRGRGGRTSRGTTRSTSGTRRTRTRRKKSKGKKRRSKKNKIIEKEVEAKLNKDTGGDEGFGKVSLYGNQFDLDEIHAEEESEDDWRDHKVHVPSAQVDTPDVVGSIMGNFHTLNPENVVVDRDGYLKDKNSVKKEEKKTAKVTKKRKKKIRFMVSSRAQSDSDIDEKPKHKDEDKETKREKSPPPPSIPSDQPGPSGLQREREISERKWLKSQSKKTAKNRELDRMIRSQLEEMRKKPRFALKSQSSMHAMSTFKIPKKKKKEQESVEPENMEEKVIGETETKVFVSDKKQNSSVCPPTKNDKQKPNNVHVVKTPKENVCGKTNENNKIKQNSKTGKTSGAIIKKNLREPVAPPLTLERKIALHQSGQLDAVLKQRSEIVERTKAKCLEMIKRKPSTSLDTQNNKPFNKSKNVSSRPQPVANTVENLVVNNKFKRLRHLERKESIDEAPPLLSENENFDADLSLNEPEEEQVERVKVSLSDYKTRTSKRSSSTEEVPEKIEIPIEENTESEKREKVLVSNSTTSKKSSLTDDLHQKGSTGDIPAEIAAVENITEERKELFDELFGKASPIQPETLESKSLDNYEKAAKNSNKLSSTHKTNFEATKTTESPNNNKVRDLPVAVVKPSSPRAFSKHNTPKTSQKTYRKRPDAKQDNEKPNLPVIAFHKGKPIIKSSSVDKSTHENEPPSSRKPRLSSDKSNPTSSNEPNKTGHKPAPIEKKYVEMVKSLLKDDYKNKKITKDEWKLIVKQAVHKIEKYEEYFKKYEKVEAMVKTLVKLSIEKRTNA